jgi:hypothetical protein
MKNIECRVGLLRPTLEPLMPQLQLSNRPIERYFSLFSRDMSGQPQINLSLDLSNLAQAHIPDTQGTDLVGLHRSLWKLVGRQRQNAQSPRIGLIFADQYLARNDVFGIMFDTPFDPTPVPSDVSQVSREGCAVFLEAIYRWRQRLGEQAQHDEAIFTAIHELGHIFNLWHLEDQPNLMASSDPNQLHDSGFYLFLPPHRTFLSHCTDSPYVNPTGSVFGSRGNLGPNDSSVTNIASTLSKLRPHPSLDLVISTSHQEFLPFEPVELYISARLKRDRKRTVTSLPDIIDPGYEDCKIWLDRPNGERVMYRPTVYYCQNPGYLNKVTASEPYERDISIFGQAGGYTFSMPGEHKIHVTIALPNGGVLKSNTEIVNVKTLPQTKSGSPTYTRTLRSSKIARALFYRGFMLNTNEKQMLLDTARHMRNTATFPSIYYCLAYQHLYRDNIFLHDKQKRRKQAQDLLMRASQHKQFDEYRRTKALKTLAILHDI